MRCFLNVASLLQSRMSIGNKFQADGAETAKALSVNRRGVRGVLKSPLDLERFRLSISRERKVLASRKLTGEKPMTGSPLTPFRGHKVKGQKVCWPISCDGKCAISSELEGLRISNLVHDGVRRSVSPICALTSKVRPQTSRL